MVAGSGAVYQSVASCMPLRLVVRFPLAVCRDYNGVIIIAVAGVVVSENKRERRLQRPREVFMKFI